MEEWMTENEVGSSSMDNWFYRYTPTVLSGFCFLSFLISMPGVWLGLHEYCIKNRVSNLRTERIVLYLSCASSAMSFIGSFHWVAFYNSKLCAAVGFFWFVACISVLVITICIGIHLLLQIYQPKMLSTFQGDKMKKYKQLEFIYLIFVVFGAIVFSVWPLIGKAYGYNGWVCWIDGHNTDGSINWSGYITIYVFYPFTLLGLAFSACVFVMVKIILCVRKRNTPNLYIWAFSVYLFTTLVVMFMTIVFACLKSSDSLELLKGSTVICSGLSPLMGSLSTSFAVIYKKVFHRPSRPVPQQLPRHDVRYGSMSSATSGRSNKQINWTSTQPISTHWIPPSTGLINSDRSDAYCDDYFDGIDDAVITHGPSP